MIVCEDIDLVLSVSSWLVLICGLSQFPTPATTIVSHSMLGKISADDILKKTFLIFPQKIGFDISCKLSPKLHELSKPNFWEK